MSRVTLPNVMVGNDFITPSPKLQTVSPSVHGPLPSPTPPVLNDIIFVFEKGPKGNGPFLRRLLNLLHSHSLIAFAVLFFIVACSAVIVGARYWSAHITLGATASTGVHIPARPLRGPNITIASTRLSDTLQQIVAQPINLVVGSQSVPISDGTIRGWLKVVTDKNRGVSYIHVDSTAINKTLKQAASPLVKAPVSQVTATHADGSAFVISAGQDGTKLGDTSQITKQLEQDLLGAKGMRLKVPVTKQAFASVTAANFNKLIEVNVITKQMYLYDNGKLTRSYPISAGAPWTPTPIGQFKIYQKLAVQDMRGYNVDGTKYFQPHVHWINYFLPGGYAVHGNYWRPLSWFGAINSSHGCVSLPDYEAEWVYGWAPIGTTVITHY